MLRRIGIRPGELPIVGWAALTLFLLGWADASTKNVSEVLFANRVGVDFFPAAFMVSSLLLVGTTYAVASLADRADRVRLLSRVLLTLAVLLLPLWLLLRTGHVVGAALPLLLAKQVESVALIAFLLALGDLLHPRQSKRLLAPLMAGMTLGYMLGSFASDPIADVLGIDGLLPFSAAVMAIASVCALPLRSVGRPRLPGDADDGPMPTLAPVAVAVRGEATGVRRLWRESQLFRLLALLTAFNALLGPMLYYQFQYVAFKGSDGENQLLTIYAQFRGWISVGILVIQLGLASNLFRRIGLPLAAAISPMVYLLGFVGLSIQLSLTAGVAALAGTKLVDDAVFDPALRVLYNLFREGIRARAGALLEGPVKRTGGVLGNLLTQAAIAVGGAGLVGFIALPAAAAWTTVALLLWRIYPRLLLGAAGTRGTRGLDPLPISELLDRGTERMLAQRLISPDPEVCRVAMDLCAEADPLRAVGSFARAAGQAPETTRPMLVLGLDRLLEAAVADPITSRDAADDLVPVLARDDVHGLERANLVQAYGRLTLRQPDPKDRTILEGALASPDAAVRLAARTALHRRGDENQATITDALSEAVASEDSEERHIAREELRALLLQGSPEEDGLAFQARAEFLARLLERPEDRGDAAEALADVVRLHGENAVKAAEPVLALWGDPDPRVHAAALRCAGHGGLRSRARALLDCIDAPDDRVAAAAHEAVLALGTAAADVLLVELSYGRRSRREAILRLVREIEVGQTALRALYQRELDEVHRTLFNRAVLGDTDVSPIVLQRLDERLEEGLHALLQLLAALHDEESIGDVGTQLRRARDPRRRAIFIEAIEALLDSEDRRAILPLVEDRPVRHRAEAVASSRGMPLPPVDVALDSLQDDPDELTRVLAQATGARRPLAAGEDLGDHASMLEPVEIALYLRKTPLFESLSTRNLIEIASVTREERVAADDVLFREGESGTAMYLIVAGRIRIVHGERMVAELGPEEFFGEMGMLEGVTRSAAAVAACDVHLLRLERDDLLALMEELPAIAIGVAQELSRRLRQATEQIA